MPTNVDLANYCCDPEAEMDSLDAMRPGAALALDCALRGRAGKRLTKRVAKPKVAAKKITRNKASD